MTIYNTMINKNTIQKTGLALIMAMMGFGSAWADIWDGTVPSTVNVSITECNRIGITGSGTEASPYVISNAQQFAYFASKMNNNTNWWKLDDDIDLDGTNHEWTYGKNNWTFKGHFDGNNKTISNMKIETNVTGRGWGLFSQLQGSSATDHAFIKNLTIENFTIATPGSSTSYAAANIGLLVGKANGNTDIENITVTGGSITVDVTATGGHNVAAVVGQLATNENNVKNCSVSNVSITSGTALKKEYYVGGITGNASNYAVIIGNTVSDLTVTIGGNTNGNNIIGGLVGKITGVNSTAATDFPMGKRSLVKKNTVTSSTITMNGSVDVANFYLGGMIGWIGNHTNAFNNKVESPTISIINNINATSYVGGAIGYQDGYTFVDGMTVNGTGSITGPSTDKTVKNSVVFFVGGYLGYMVNTGVNAFQANKFKNIAVTGMNINLGHYVPAAQIQNHKFSVGGIAGAINAPNMTADYSWDGVPENLIFKGGKIYAPYATTSPIVANFNAGVAAQNNMTLDVTTTVDAIKKAKSNTWYYNDYKLGLSPEFLNSTSVTGQTVDPTKDKFRKNYSKTPETSDGISYLAIDNSTFDRNNRYLDSERDYKTVLWWTQAANYTASGAAAAAFTADEQPFYPNNAAATAGNATNFPYYWYFFQGVAHAKYAKDADAGKIVEGIEANFTNDVMPTVAIAKENNLTVNIINEGETRRGFDNRKLTVSVKQGNSDVTANYTYKWYVDGVENGTDVEGVKNVSGGSVTLAPHWKDGKGVTVNVINGTTVVATASYGFAPGVLNTKASVKNPTSENVRSDISNRGTKDNPYIIDCENALRQLSYLSTVHTNTFWETLGKPATPYATNQIQGHYDRAYYELDADIDLKNNEFTPISHVGYSTDGTWGTYNTNWIFQGVFDGKGHKISNLKITWRAGQFNGNNTNIYHGLFGCVGNAAAAPKWGDKATNLNTEIKNLVIDGATLTHDKENTTFTYPVGTNANYCMVGVLAGIVTSNTTIQNIEIRNSKITDEGSFDYSLAAKGLYVGGAIGSVQAAYNATANAPANTKIQHIAAQVDITLNQPTIVNEADATQTASFNVGGILGRYIATSATKASVDVTVPAYTLYSGTINASKAWISPVVASLRYNAQQGFNFNNHSKHWEGNNNTAATQITISNALYYNLYIGSAKITDTTPANSCGMGSRTMTAHTDGSDNSGTYSAQKYQGVNYGARCIPEQGVSLELFNQDLFEKYNFVWDENPGTFVHMTTEPYIVLSLSRASNTNNFTVSLNGATTTSYTWQVSFNGTTWHTVAGETGATYTVPVSLKTKYVKASTTADNGKTYTTLFEIVEGDKELCVPEITSAVSDGKTVFTFNLNQKNPSPDPAPELKTTYQWYKTNKEADILTDEKKQTLEVDNTTLESYSNIVWCKAVVSEYEEVLETYFIIYGATVVYVKGDGGTDNPVDPETGELTGRTHGWSPEDPVRTINNANKLLKSEADGGTIDNNIIVIMGLLNDDYKFQSKGKNPATLTGFYKKDYKGVIRLMQVDQTKPSTNTTSEHLVNRVNQDGQPGANCYVLGDTKFENLTFYGNQQGNTFIELHGRDVIFGKGLVMQNFKKLSKSHGNFGEQESIPELTILLTATNLPEADIKAYTKRIHKRGKPQVVTFQSGHYGRLMGGRFTESFFANSDNSAHSILASADYPIWAEINVEIDVDNEQTDLNGTTYTRDVNAIIAGLTDGSMYGDYTINFHGGNVAYIVGANQGNPVNNGSKTYTPLGGVNGTWGQWPNASYFGRTIINIEDKSGDPYLHIKPITVGNLYAGGLGRMSQSGTPSAAVDMYVYGRTEVNVKSGTVSGSVYGGGVGGVLGVNPWDAHVPYATTLTDTEGNPTTDEEHAIINNVQYGDTRFESSWGSTMTTDSPMAKVKLHNINADGITYSTEDLDLRYSSTTVNVFDGNVNGNIYGGGYGYVQDMNDYSAMQGIGSVFGTTNINVSGGDITGNIYGGSQGDARYYQVHNKYNQLITNIAEMNGTVNINISGSPIIGGDIYGAGKGITSSNTEEYLRIATTGNTDLGGEYKSTVNITINLDENASVRNVFGGGELGAVDGQTNVTINSGQINGNVYGGGKGEKGHLQKARVNGTTNVTVGY